jgi:hypothetical protein
LKPGPSNASQARKDKSFSGNIRKPQGTFSNKYTMGMIIAHHKKSEVLKFSEVSFGHFYHSYLLEAEFSRQPRMEQWRQQGNGKLLTVNRGWGLYEHTSSRLQN